MFNFLKWARKFSFGLESISDYMKTIRGSQPVYELLELSSFTLSKQS